MNIKLKYLKFHNFLSFQDGELGFNSSGYTLVQGKNKNVSDMAVSNGSGKSSIFEAISWCITGELVRGSKSVKRLSSDEKDPCWVSLEFDIDDNKYGLCRQSNPSKLQFIVNGKDISGKGIRDTEKILQEYLPNLNSSLIGSVMILGQGLPQRFSNNTPSGRKEVLETLSNSDVMIYDLKDRISRRANELSEKDTDLKNSRLKLITQKEMKEKEVLSAKDKINNLPPIDNITANINSLNLEIKSLTSEIKNTSSKIDDLSIQKDAYQLRKSNLMNQKTNHITEEVHDYDIKLAELKEQQIEYQTIIKSKQSEVTRLKNIKDVCPTCGQKLPGVEKVDTTNLENEIDSIKNLLSETINEFNYINEIRQNVILVLSNSFDADIQSVTDKINSFDDEIKDLSSFVNNANNKLRNESIELSRLQSELTNREKYINELSASIDDGNKFIEQVSNEILYINNNEEELQKHIDVIQKMKTIVNRDFRGYLLSSVIDFINRKAKEYAQEVFETDKLDFSLNGNSIDICYAGKEYSNLSGGERQKIDLIIQFAIRDMLCKYLGFSSNIIVVDELFDNLDSVGCEKILNLISSKLTDVENIYIITHHADIPIPFDNILLVTKGEDGISRIN